MTCETCRWWNSQGTESARKTRFRESKQIWMRPCQRFPVFEPRWFDDWCGEWAATDAAWAAVVEDAMQ